MCDVLKQNMNELTLNSSSAQMTHSPMSSVSKILPCV